MTNTTVLVKAFNTPEENPTFHAEVWDGVTGHPVRQPRWTFHEAVLDAEAAVGRSLTPADRTGVSTQSYRSGTMTTVTYNV